MSVDNDKLTRILSIIDTIPNEAQRFELARFVYHLRPTLADLAATREWCEVNCKQIRKYID